MADTDGEGLPSLCVDIDVVLEGGGKNLILRGRGERSLGIDNSSGEKMGWGVLLRVELPDQKSLAFSQPLLLARLAEWTEEMLDLVSGDEMPPRIPHVLLDLCLARAREGVVDIVPIERTGDSPMTVSTFCFQAFSSRRVM